MPDDELQIGEVAKRTGLRPSAIRYYESIGLLPEPSRVSGQRRYPLETLRTLAVIGTAQRAGLELAEIRELLGSTGGASEVSERLRAIAERKLPEVEALIERALAMRAWLELARECRCGGLDVCELFAAPSAR